jgi:hypothetical protein
LEIQGIASHDGGYRAGACNIGAEEIASRRRGGLMGVGVAVAIALVLVVIGAPPWTRVLVFPPLAGGLISLEQARRHFCVGFALAGLRNFGPLGDPDHITDDIERATDRRSALLMTGYCSVIAAVITLVFVVAPI